MPTRNQNIVGLTRLSAFLLLAVLVLLNVLARRSNVRVDLTEDGIYTLTDASKDVLRGLEDPATIKVYWDNMPEAGEGARRFTESILREMKAESGGRLDVRWVDCEDEDGKTEADDDGVQMARYQTRSAGEIRAMAGYCSLVVEVGDAKSVLDDLVNLGPRFEYEVISRLNKMVRTETPVIGLVAPQPHMNPLMAAQGGGRFRQLSSILREQYGAGFRSQISLDQPVPADVRVLAVIAPQDLEPKAVYHLEQFVLRGGRLLLLLDPVHAPIGRAPSSRPESSGVEEWLSHLGITVKPGVVGDLAAMQKRPRIVQSPFGRAWDFIRYPYWPMLRAPYMDQENPATRDFDQIPMYWPAALSLDEAKHEAAGRTTTLLATTTEHGWTRDDLIGLDTAEQDFSGMTKEDLERDAVPHIPVMVLVEGPIESFWKGRPAPGEEEKAAEAEDPHDHGENGSAPGEPGDENAPDGPETPDTPATPEDADVPEAPEDPKGPEVPEEPAPPAPPKDPEAEEGEEGDEGPQGPERLDAGEGRILVMTDAELVDDQVVQMRMFQGFEFVLNILDWMSGSDALLELRARTPQARNLDLVEPKEQKLVQWLNVIVIPLLVLFAGIVVFIVRRYQR